MSSAEGRKQRRAMARLRRGLWGAVIALIAGMSVAVALRLGQPAGSIPGVRASSVTSDRQVPTGLDRFGEVPRFSLIERSGRSISASDLLGKAWIVDFIYTRCTDTCPLQSAHMARLQADLSGHADVRLVSITIDPEYDSPGVLSRYAARFHADRDRWLFLTGSRATIARLAVWGFHLGLVNAGPETPPARIRLAHSSRFALVDRHAQIRGYYEGTDWNALTRLRGDLKTLLAAG